MAKVAAPHTAEHGTAVEAAVPLCVDIDGTLIRTDAFVEAALQLLRRNPAYAALMLRWVLRGKAVLKAEVLRRAAIDVHGLPENTELLEWLRGEKANGRRLLLCTGAAAAYAEAVAERFGLFDRVLASDERVNLTASKKAERLVAEFGERGFDYAGNAVCDLSVWRHARAAIVVAPTVPLRMQLQRVPRLAELFARPRSRAAAWVRAARPHQWTKNALIFVPVLAAQVLGDFEILTRTLIAFVAFSVTASGVYMQNDLLDLASDRAHPRKGNRPFACGDLQAAQGIMASVLLVGVGLAAGYVWLGWLFLLALGGYVVGAVAYSFDIKRRPGVDILWLAGLYTGRILAGSAATAIAPSFWLLAFSMFLFLSLAAAKRSAELVSLESRRQERTHGRGYAVGDQPLLLSFGVAAAYTSVLVLALYVHSGANELYARPELLWLLCPLLLYWVSRVWLKMHRRELHDDPLVFALTDVPSVAVGVASAGLIWLAA